MKNSFFLCLMAVAAFQSHAQSSLKLVVPIGHTRPVTTLAITPDDKLILSGGADNLIHLWSVDGGRLLKTYRGHNNAVSKIIISKSGKFFFSLDNDRKGFVREIATGMVLDSVLTDYNNTTFYSAEKDGFGWLDENNKLHYWSPGKSQVIESQKDFYQTAISPNGKYLLAISAEKEGYYNSLIQDVHLITLQTGTLRMLRKVNVAEGNQLAFSADSKLAFVGDDGNAVFAHDTQTGQTVSYSTNSIWLTTFEVGASGLLKLNCYDGLRLWDPIKKIIKPFSDIEFRSVNQPASGLVPLGAVFKKAEVDSLKNADWWLGSKCVSVSWSDELFSLPVTEWGTKKDVIEILSQKSAFAYFKPGTTKPALLPAVVAVKLNGKNWIARSRDRSIAITDLDTNKDVKELRGIDSGHPNNVAFSPDGRSLVYHDRHPRLWNFNQSKMLTLPADSSGAAFFVQPKEGTRLILVGDQGKIQFLNADIGTVVHTMESDVSHPFGRVTNIQVSNDKKFLIWVDDANRSFIKKMNWDNLDWYKTYRSFETRLHVNYTTKEEGSESRHTFTESINTTPVILPYRDEFFSGLIMSRYRDTPYLMKQAFMDKLNNAEASLPYVYVDADPSAFGLTALHKFSFSNNGNRVLFWHNKQNSQQEISWLDITKNDSTNRYEASVGWYPAELLSRNFYYFRTMAAVIHPEQPWFAFSNLSDNSIVVRMLQYDSVLKPFIGHTDWVNSIAFSVDGKFMASTSLDNTVRIWDVETRQEIITLVTLGSKEWVVSHPSGLFDASPGAMNYIYFSTGIETIGLEQIKDRFYEPNLLKKALAGENLRTVSGLDKIDLHPAIQTTLDSLNAKLVVTVTDQGGGIGKTTVFVNAKEVVEDLRNQVPSGSKGTFTTTVDLSTFKNLVWGDMNFIGVKAYNGSGYISSPIQKIYYQAPAKQEHLRAFEPNLYCLVVGVSDYQNDELDLKYSAKDAQDFAQAVSTAGKRLFGNRANITLLTSDAQAETLKPTKTNVSRVMKEISAKAQIDDMVIMYFSGHGTNLSGDDADFLYLTADARGFSFIDPAIRQSSTISSSELTEFMKGMAAQKQVLIFDACASGRMVENMLAKRDVPSSTLRAMERMKDRTGTYILTGCAADAVSYEASQFGQGLLTYSLLSGMRGAALRDNKFVDVLRLFQYAKEEVPKLAEHVGGIQEPKVFSPYGGESFDIGLLEDTDKKLIPLTEAKPFLVRSSFQNELKLRDDLGLSKLIDQAIAEQAISGKNASFIFVDSPEFPGAIYISGRYKIENGNTILKVVLFKDDKLMGSLDKTLNTSDPVKLQSAVIEFVQETVVKK